MIQSHEFNDINDNHVGVDINSLESTTSTSASYCATSGGFMNLTLISGHPMQVWVEYDGVKKQINVTLAPINVDKPKIPLLSLSGEKVATQCKFGWNVMGSRSKSMSL